MSDFRDAIAAAVHLPGVSEDSASWLQANNVLAMPEMQAIRNALWSLHNESDPDLVWFHLRSQPTVMAWVLDGEP